MTGPERSDGWLMIPYSGDDLARVEIRVDGVVSPAYRNWAPDGTRVVQIRAGQDALGRAIILEVNGTVQASFGAAPPGRAPRHSVT